MDSSCNSYTFIAIIILYIFVFIYISNNDLFSYFSTIKIEASDGTKYRVLGNYEDYKDAAEMLAELNKKIVILAKHLKKKYHTDSGHCPQKVKEVSNLLNRYLIDELSEVSPNSSSDTSYTLNKRIINMCLRDKDENKLHDINIMVFVTLHEASHVCTDTRNHGPPFWQTFKWILTEAEECEIYKNIDLSKNAFQYNKFLVDYSPFFDSSVKDLCER